MNALFDLCEDLPPAGSARTFASRGLETYPEEVLMKLNQGGAILPGLAMRGFLRALSGLVIAAIAVSVTERGTARAEPPPEDFYVTNGNVYATAVSGNTLYIGGNFTHVGPATGGFVPIAAATGQAGGGFPKVTGAVHAMAPDGAGGWFIGGNFTRVGGVPRSNLAHVLADNSVADWAPNATFGSFPAFVYAIAVSGSTVYVGGRFTTVGGQFRRHLAALNAGTGLPTSWDPSPDDKVYALALSDSSVFVGGVFDSIADQSRPDLARLSATTALARPFPTTVPSYGTPIYALAVNGSRLYVGGSFQFIGSELRYNLAAIDLASGTLDMDWSPSTEGTNRIVYALGLSSSTLFVGGIFDAGGER